VKGIFTLRTADDLRLKLKRDLEKLKKDPLNGDLAFNFFVTAEHMLDWVYPTSTSKRTAERGKSILLQICSHLANGAKHFEATDPRHKSVSSTERSSSWAGWGDSWGSSWSSGPLVVRLKGDAAKQLGGIVAVIDLAEKVMAYWDKHPLK
jgi:hypothetical protein